MLSRMKNKTTEGFTIIEVMIVLAIAALILLIVFLAVPALQRNARNTQRSTDANNLVAAYNEYVNNTGGTTPVANCTGATPCAWYSNAKLGFYTIAANYHFVVQPNPAATVPGGAANVELNEVYMYTYETCGSSTTAANGTSPQNVATIYYVETGSGTQLECRTAG
jgi:prepilin-type N-terminal cleavage/methylation domain-containing protein